MPMGDRHQKAGTGPRDFSAEVHAQFTSPVPEPHITVRIYLSDEEAGKVTAGDVSAAVAELLARLGVDMGHCWAETTDSGDEEDIFMPEPGIEDVRDTEGRL